MTGQPNDIRVLVADDHPAMRAGLIHAITAEPGMVVVGEAVDGQDAIEQFEALRPGLILMDIQMPRVDGLEAIAAIRERDRDVVIVVLTTYPGDARVMRALTLGATGYLLKSATTSEILVALHSAIEGKRVIAAEVRNELAKHTGSELLTHRELSVLRLVANGRSNREIGEELSIAEETVKSRIRNILSKLGANDRTHAVTLAMQRGFLDM
ncbi:response regulator [Luteibacter sp.]|uniref:response regulator n=1 Tax=Luteibacter sp. TaxID=1886636 RepID=UPI003F821B6F